MSIVSVEKCENYSSETLTDALYRTFDNLGGVERFIKPGMKVVLKPNFVMGKKPEAAATTHPAFIKAVASIVLKAGARVIIAESPGGLYTKVALKNVYNLCGVKSIAEEIKQESGREIELNLDLDSVEVDNQEGKLLKKVTIIKPIADADLVINLPKLKTHGQMVYTGAVKNLFGTVPGALKAEYHFRMAQYDSFADALIDIFLSVKPALNIMDAVWGMEGNGPTAGDPRHIGLILASENAFELDITAINIIGANPAYIPVMKQAEKRGICKLDGGEISVKGEKISDVKVENFNIPQLDALRAIEFYDKGILKHIVKKLKPRPVFNHDACIGCGECARSCPAKIIEMKNKRPRADLSKCIRCFCCQELCPAKAVKIKRPFFANFILRNK